MLDFIPFLLLALVFLLSFLIPLFRGRQKTTVQGNVTGGSVRNESLNDIISAKRQEQLQKRMLGAESVITHSESDFTGNIAVPADIELLETEKCLLIKGPVESIAAICDDLSVMEQLPDGFCMQLGEWRLYVLEALAQSSRELKTVVMPRDHWLFMSCKLRDSIMGYDVHPYNYVFEPFTFKQVLDYGIGVEATDMPDDGH